MKYLKFLILISTLFIGSKAYAQKIVDVGLVGQIAQTTGQLFLFSLGVNVELDNGIDVFRVTYTTTGSDMMPDTASGLIMLPDEISGPLPILIYQHGTTDGRDDVPSNLEGGYQLGAIFAGKGMAVIAPDFLGMGVSRGFHPYVHADTEATAAVDLLEALRSYMAEQEIDWNDQLFITGYSQGGHAAMAVHRYIELLIPDQYEVTASLPMSGPYSLSGVMLDRAFGDEPYNFPSYLVYSSRALREVNPFLYGDESSLFKEVFLPAINEFVSTGKGLGALNQSISQTLIDMYGAIIPKQLFIDEVRESIETDPDHPFNVALRESDLFDWAPKAPVLMLYCKSDDQVPFRNSVIADSVMNLAGAINTKSMDVANGMDFDHSDCVVPALNEGIPWLFSFVDNTTPTIELAKNTDASIFPNPSSGHLNITSSIEIEHVSIYSIDGRMVYSKGLGSTVLGVDLRGLNQGMYLVNIFTAEGLTVRKLVVK